MELKKVYKKPRCKVIETETELMQGLSTWGTKNMNNLIKEGNPDDSEYDPDDVGSAKANIWGHWE